MKSYYLHLKTTLMCVFKKGHQVTSKKTTH